MNKRKKKKVLAWWFDLLIDQKDDYHKVVNSKSKNKYISPSENEKEKMYDWAMNSNGLIITKLNKYVQN